MIRCVDHERVDIGHRSWQEHRCRRHGRNPFATPNKTEPSLVVALMLTWLTSSPNTSAMLRPHCVTMRANAGALADQCEIGVHDLAASRLHPRPRLL